MKSLIAAACIAVIAFVAYFFVAEVRRNAAISEAQITVAGWVSASDCAALREGLSGWDMLRERGAPAANDTPENRATAEKALANCPPP